MAEDATSIVRDEERTLYLIDAMALAYRSHYIFISRPLFNSKGLNTSATYGFTNSLLKLIEKHDMEHIAVVFEGGGGNFREEIYAEYKANRDEMPEDPFSKAGDEMIKLKLEVEGHGVCLFDYLVATESSFWKIDTFRKAIGDKVVEGEEVELHAADLEGRQGYARLKVEEYQGKQNNKVDIWLTRPPVNSRKSTTASATPAAAAETEDDNEPF